jgi:hypothetical protein
MSAILSFNSAMNLDNYRVLLKVGAISAFSYYLGHYLHELVKAIRDAAEIKEKEVNNLS